MHAHGDLDYFFYFFALGVLKCNACSPPPRHAFTLKDEDLRMTLRRLDSY